MISLHDVSKIFNSGKANEYAALQGITVDIAPRRVTVLKGPSGSGKTTLLSILGGMARPTTGRIVLFDREISSLPERFLSDIRRRTFGFIFQQFNLIRGISLLENVMIPAYPMGERHGLLKARAMATLEAYGLAGRAATRVELLSGGEMQRAAIARALINDPPVIIADEPTAHLDTKLSSEFLDHMTRLKDEGKTIIMASHDPLVIDAGLVDRIVAIRDGRLADGAAP
ncbi:ABC transporter ATP-binding protein [Geobacter sulfurreducens]|uniref:ABC transporter ATP-binding protein n=1 Tax=Geobacter sulfurreducens TaxID=35554 RepID=UPI000DBB9F99|nr:ABC transporter ATP-binding protein [Geobacter sulfurreducens]BBA69785.1 putative ABC transporter ATP-binding protein YknY [Geobacter sulfurreducens]